MKDSNVYWEEDIPAFIYKLVREALEAQEKEFNDTLHQREEGLIAIGFREGYLHTRKQIHADLIAVADEGEYEDMRRDVERYFNSKK